MINAKDARQAMQKAVEAFMERKRANEDQEKDKKRKVYEETLKRYQDRVFPLLPEALKRIDARIAGRVATGDGKNNVCIEIYDRQNQHYSTRVCLPDRMLVSECWNGGMIVGKVETKLGTELESSIQYEVYESFAQMIKDNLEKRGFKVKIEIREADVPNLRPYERNLYLDIFW